MSISEKVLWEQLRHDQLGYRFRRQYPIHEWVLDFYCPEVKLCVEVDGEQHLLTKDRDQLRDADLASLGIHTLRIPSLDLFAHSSSEFSLWMREIERLCRERQT